MRQSLIIPVLFILAHSFGYSQNGPGGMAGAPFRLGFDARGIGMGNAMAARAFADNASVYNPSLLPYVTSQNIHLGAAILPLDRSLFHVSYSTPLPPTAGLGFSAMGARVGDIQGRDVNGRPTDIYSTNEYAFALSFGLQPSPGFTIGASAKLLHARLIPEVASTTVGLDFGASYLVTQEVLLALVLRDVGSKYRWDTTPVYGRDGNNTVDKFPRRLIFGAGWSPRWLPLLLNIEAESISGLFVLRAGTEFELHPDVTIRAGVDGIDPDRVIGTRFMVGLSLEGVGVAWNPSLDYAFMIEPLAYVGSHFLTVRFHIGE